MGPKARANLAPMRDVLPQVEAWLGEGRKVALGTVVATWGSAPRPVGSHLAVSDALGLVGSVSGGCVETAVVQAAQEVLKDGAPRLLRFGVSDDKAWAVGLACGGTVEVFVESLDLEVLDALRRAVAHDHALGIATVIAGPDLGRHLVMGPSHPFAGSLEGTRRDAARQAIDDALRSGAASRTPLPDGELFVEVLTAPPTLVVVGGVHIATALVELARTLGYRTVVVDPRPAFANRERFPHADRLEASWPDEALAAVGLTSATAVAVLTHDPKLDDPALRVALPSPAFYVGALGSRKTQARRRERLREAGLGDEHLDRLRAPIGLDLGGRSPEEIALAVMAEVVACRHGRRPAPMAPDSPASA
jgi:xanthine dehydrogenase accessory factor